MVSFTRYGATNIFVNGDVRMSRCGIIGRGVAGTTLTLDASAPDTLSFAIWDSLAKATDAQIAAFFKSLSDADGQLPGMGSVLVRGYAAAAAAGAIRFERAGDHPIGGTSPQIALTGTRAGVTDQYRLKIDTGNSPAKVVVARDQLIISQPHGQIVFIKGSSSVPQALRGDLVIPLSGAEAGRLRFNLDIVDELVFSGLSAVLRADFKKPGFGGDESMSRSFPLFRPYRAGSKAAHTILLRGSVDPFELSAPTSGFDIAAVDEDGNDGLIETHFVTSYGHPVVLKAPSDKAVRKGEARAPRLVFTEQGVGAGIFKPNVSLLPEGDFDIVLPTAGKTAMRESFGIVCGLSEREYMPVEPGQRLAFRVREAFAGLWPENDKTAVGEKPFEAHTKSSWVGVLAADGTPVTAIVSEDRDYSLFKPEQGAASLHSKGAGVALRHAPIRLQPRAGALLTVAGRKAAVDTMCLPLFPWKGLRVARGADEVSEITETFAPADLRRIEQRALAPKRRALVEPETTAAPAAKLATSPRYTPIGLEMRVSAGDVMQSLVLADVGNVTLELHDIQPDLADALLRANLFLVADRLDKLAKLKPSVSIAGWGFEADLVDAKAAPGDGPVLIIKGRKGKLADLLSQHEGWALSNRLCSTGAAATAKRIVELHKKVPPKTGDPDEDAIQDAAFQKITDIFEDPDWTGVLVYNVRLDPSQLPDQITGLLGGVGKEIRVHHIGVDVRRVEPGAAAAPTPMFGAVAYWSPTEDQPPEIATGDFYAFKLGRLIVSFNNGQVGQFLAKGKLATARLFGGEASDNPQPLTRRKAAAVPVIDIKGRYEARIERGERIDVYTFETIAQGAGRIIHLPSGGVIRQIILKKITFSTVSVDRGDPAFLLARTRFLIDGRIVFNKWPSGEVSLFQDGAAFSFTELGIDFDFKLKLNPISIEGLPAFRFSPGGISVDFGSLPSMKSLLGKLPFRFRSFELWPKGIDFGKLGFTSLTAGRTDTKNEGEFGFIFDLSLGSLGSLAEKFKDFKLSLLLGFGFDVKGRKPKFALGFKFAGSGGAGLDIGIGNVLRIRADGYDVGKHPTKDLYFAYAVNAKLQVMDHTLPKDAKLNLFLFIDPKPQAPALAKTLALASMAPRAALPPLSSVGWFGIMTDTDGDDGMVSLKTLALGQRILLMKGGDPGPGVSVSDYLDTITSQLGNLPESVRKALEANRIETVTGEMLKLIDYAPERAWMIGLKTKIARILDLDLLVRDPDLYGIHINFKKIIDLDILYRKLSDELGVYSVNLVPPESLRRITTGPADIILPVIGLDFYTDGGVHGHLGFPYKRDFSRSATVEILPFVGAGGMRAGLFRSGGSQLVPQLRYKDDYVYDPVIEIGIGLRVGLGKSIEKGPFRAALSLTIYAYLEGAQGQLKIKNPNSVHPQPADAFRVLQGAVGIMGEIIGHVDFGIVKAKVEIIAYVEGSIRVRTDDFVLLAYEAGVTVRITVVVARFKVFGKTIEIKVSFSFATTVQYRTTAGSRIADWDDKYIDGPKAARHGLGRAAGWRQLSAPEREAWLEPPIDWDIPAPAVLGLQTPLPLELWFMPDMAAARDPSGGTSLEAVFKLYLESAPTEDDAQKPYDRFARTLTLWTIWAGLKGLRSSGDPNRPLDWIVDRDQLDMLARRITGADDAAERPGERLPDYAAWTGLLGSCFAIEITQAPQAGGANGAARTAVFFPMPSDVEILRHFPGETVTTRIDTRRFVDPDFEDEIEENFAWMRAHWEDKQGRTLASRMYTGKTLAEVLFEEYGGFLLRTFADAAAQVVKPGETLKVSALLDRLHKTTDARPLRDAGAAASRFFNHGLALPRASVNLWAQVKPHLPEPLAALGHNDPDAVMPIFRYASLQLGMTRQAGATSPVEQVEAVGLRASATGGWFKVAADLARFDVGTGDPITELAGAVSRLEPYAQTIAYQSVLDRERIVTRRPLLHAPAARRDFADPAGVVQMRVLELPVDLADNSEIQLASVKVEQREIGSDAVTGLKVTPATVVTMRLRRTKDVLPDDQGRSIFEVIGAREAERLVLDTLSPVARQVIRSVDLYVPHRSNKDDATPSAWRQLKPGAYILQTNLSAEPRPEALRVVADPVFQASQEDNPALFTEIFRRASIVNSAGYWLVGEDPAPGQEEIELLLMVQFTGVQSLAGVNSLAAAPAAVPSDKLVVSIGAGEEARVLPRPGLLPILVTIPNPSYAYVVDIDGKPRRMTFEQMLELASTRAISGRKLEAAIQGQNADAQLRERFNLLEVHVADGPDFKATKLRQLLPVGSTEDGARPLAEDAPAELRFRHSLPLQELLKTASANPYGPVGKSLRLTYRLRDINGNSLPGAPREASGDLGGPITVQYYDGIVAPNELPCLVATFEAGATGTLRLALRFDLDAYQHGLARLAAAAGQARARAIRDSYRLALWQAGGRGFSAWLRTTLAEGQTSADPWAPASEGDVQITALDALSRFYEAVLVFVEAEAQGGRRRKKTAPSATLDIKIAQPASAAFIEPSVVLEFRRDPTLVHNSIEDAPNALAASMRVSPTFELVTVEKDREPALKIFANQLATRLLGGAYIGAKGGPPQTGRSGASLWLVRTDVLPRATTSTAAAPAFLALPPLSNRPESFKNFKYPILVPGDVESEASVDLIDIDLDVHGQAALERLETLLAPKQALKLTRSKAGQALLEQVLAVKEMLAAALSERADYILGDALKQDENRQAARDALRSRLTARLTAAYEIDTLLAYRLSWPAATASTTQLRPGVFGQLDLRTQAPDVSPPVGGQLIAMPKTGAASSPVTIAYDLAPKESLLSATPKVDVGDLTISHVQRRPQPDRSDIFKLPPQERYRATQWLRLLDPYIVGQLRQTGLDVPVVLRNVPTKPEIKSQSFVPSNPTSNTLEQWRKCRVTGSWSWDGKPSDNVVAILRYWPSGESVAFQRQSRSHDLGAALLRFSLATEGCWSRVTDTPPFPDALLDYLAKCVAALGTAQPFADRSDPAAVEDRIRFAQNKTGAWVPDLQQLQDAHKLSYTLNNEYGTVAIENVDVTRYSRARFGLELYRNRAFTLDGKVRETAGQFVYHLTGFWGSEPLTPHVRRPKPLEFRGRRTIRQHLLRILTELFDKKIGRHRIDAQMALVPLALPENLSGSPIAGDWPGATMRPVIGMYSDDVATWSKLADQAEAWLKNAALVRDDGFIALNVQVFREGLDLSRQRLSGEPIETERQPIFEASRLRIPIAEISDIQLTQFSTAQGEPA